MPWAQLATQLHIETPLSIMESFFGGLQASGHHSEYWSSSAPKLLSDCLSNKLAFTVMVAIVSPVYLIASPRAGIPPCPFVSYILGLHLLMANRSSFIKLTDRESRKESSEMAS